MRRLALAGAAWLALGSAQAGAWLAPGDPWLRHDLSLLTDLGVLSETVTTWPMPSAALDAAQAPAAPSTIAQAALDALRAHRRGGRGAFVEAATLSRVPAFRGFAALARSRATLAVGADGGRGRVSWALRASLLSPRVDRRSGWLDGSWAGVEFGGWMLRAGAIDRWWGPGWEGSLILSTNARPVPALALERASSRPWAVLGPWRLVLFQGVLERARAVPRARLFGMRFSFRPVDGLEIGLSRVAQWGGSGRPSGVDTFFRMLIGNDNIGQRGVTQANQPGNQLAGWDVRLSHAFGDLVAAAYTQWIGEDEAGRWPSRYLALGGASLAGSDWRIYLEAANTQSAFYRRDSAPAYIHAVYRSGYRYLGRVLGHGMGGGAEGVFVGAMWRTHGLSLDAHLRWIRTGVHTNRPVRLRMIELRAQVPFGKRGAWELLAGAQRSSLDARTRPFGGLRLRWAD